MTPKQQAMDNLGDFMKLLAKGCHVRVSATVYRALPGQPYIFYTSEHEYFLPVEGPIVWKVKHRSIQAWVLLLGHFNMDVVNDPVPTMEQPKRHVRSIEL